MAEYIDTRDLADKMEQLVDEIDIKETEITDIKDKIEELELEIGEIPDIEGYESEFDRMDHISQLEEEINNLTEDIELLRTDIDDLSDDLKEIRDLESEIEDFEYGVTLIPESEFTDYVREFCIDCGYITKDVPSWIEVDWEGTAKNLMADFIEVEYEGQTYYCHQ